MTIAKAKFFSLKIHPDVISEECKLWHRFVSQQQSHNLVDCIPKQNDNADWKSRVVIYNQHTTHLYKPIMMRLNQEMEKQNEIFSPVSIGSDDIMAEMMLSAIHLLCKNDDVAFALRSLVSRIVIVDCEELVGCSSPLFLGLIISAPKQNWSLYDYMENIIHEMSHIELYIKQLIDPFVIKGSYLKSPFRSQVRPASGVYHAAFVLARIIGYLTPFNNSEHFIVSLQKRIDICSGLLNETLAQFYDKKILTPAGELLFAEMCNMTAIPELNYQENTV